MSLIDNLIENAVKYSPEGGRVEVDVRSLDKSTQLRVSDAGPGIPFELRARVFDRFFASPIKCKAAADWGSQ